MTEQSAPCAHPSLPPIRQALLRPWRTWRRRRRLVGLLDLDDRMLDDIGVTREEIAWAAGLPLAQNAALDLASVSAARRKRRIAGRRRR